jgi:DNA polymerase-3 subunit delta
MGRQDDPPPHLFIDQPQNQERGLDGSPSVGKPLVYIFHGDDSLAIRRHLDDIIDRMIKTCPDPSIADLNITRLDGRQSIDDELSSAVNSMPFLAERRLVVLSYPFARYTTDATRKRFLALLNGLPDTTALVLIVPDAIEKKDWKSLPSSQGNWMRKWMAGAGTGAAYKLCSLPSAREMPEWIRKEARSQGGQFTPDGAVALAAHTGSDTQMAKLEIDKLLIYVDRKRAVDANDVEELTAQSGQADVFEMVDALAAGGARQALGLLHRLLETQDPLNLFGMITRQFRLLIQVREMLDEGRGGHITSELRLHSFVADKMTNQARRFSLPQLEAVYHRLLLMDEGIKTGQIPAELALDTFAASMTR